MTALVTWSAMDDVLSMSIFRWSAILPILLVWLREAIGARTSSIKESFLHVFQRIAGLTEYIHMHIDPILNHGRPGLNEIDVFHVVAHDSIESTLRTDGCNSEEFLNRFFKELKDSWKRGCELLLDFISDRLF